MIGLKFHLWEKLKLIKSDIKSQFDNLRLSTSDSILGPLSCVFFKKLCVRQVACHLFSDTALPTFKLRCLFFWEIAVLVRSL